MAYNQTMRITENTLRELIQGIILELNCSVCEEEDEDTEDEENLLVEPDLSREDERDSINDYDLDEISLGAGGITGYQEPMGEPYVKPFKRN